MSDQENLIESEIDALRADKERLDFIQEHDIVEIRLKPDAFEQYSRSIWGGGLLGDYGASVCIRAAIDDARKGGVKRAKGAGV